MSRDNYDDLADFCGPKEFYDLDGDGHIDGFEAGMMLSDVEDELREHKEYQTHYYSGGGSSSKEPQGCGCLSTILDAVVFGTILWVIEQLLGW